MPVKKCCVCPNKYVHPRVRGEAGQKEILSFHRFPQNAARRKAWLRSIQQLNPFWTIPDNAYVCSDHFQKEHFKNKFARKDLKIMLCEDLSVVPINLDPRVCCQNRTSLLRKKSSPPAKKLKKVQNEIVEDKHLETCFPEQGENLPESDIFLPVAMEQEKLEVLNDSDDNELSLDRSDCNNICRICAEILLHDYIMIFESEAKKIQLLQKMHQHLPIKVPILGDGLPNKICGLCIERLELCHKLAELAIKSDKLIRKSLGLKPIRSRRNNYKSMVSPEHPYDFNSDMEYDSDNVSDSVINKSNVSDSVINKSNVSDGVMNKSNVSDSVINKSNVSDSVMNKSNVSDSVINKPTINKAVLKKRKSKSHKILSQYPCLANGEVSVNITSLKSDPLEQVEPRNVSESLPLEQVEPRNVSESLKNWKDSSSTDTASSFTGDIELIDGQDDLELNYKPAIQFVTCTFCDVPLDAANVCEHYVHFHQKVLCERCSECFDDIQELGIHIQENHQQHAFSSYEIAVQDQKFSQYENSFSLEHENSLSQEHENNLLQEYESNLSQEYENDFSHEHEDSLAEEHVSSLFKEHVNTLLLEYENRLSQAYESRLSEEYENSLSQKHENSVLQDHKNSLAQEYENSLSQEHENNLSQDHEICLAQENENSLAKEHENSLSQEHENSLSQEHENSLSRELENSLLHEYENCLAQEHENNLSQELENSLSQKYENCLAQEHENNLSQELENSFSHEHENSPLQKCVKKKHEEKKLDNGNGIYEIIHKCTLCLKDFYSNQRTQKHYLSEHGQYACVLCLEVFSTSDAVNQHTQQVHMIQCKYCEETFASIFTLHRHMNTMHMALNVENVFHTYSTFDKYKCKDCSKSLESKSLLKRHNFWCHQKYTCDFCLTEFESSDLENNHFESVHGKDCFFCGFYFETSMETISHIQQEHVHNTKPFLCEFCGDRLTDRIDLLFHRKLHPQNNDLVFTPCLLCTEQFLSKTDLKRHRRKVHKNHKNFKCTKCNHTFLLESQLIQHIMTHHLNMKPFTCLECGYTCIKLSKLETHVRCVHRVDCSKDRKYRCNRCNAKFISRHDLYNHVTSAHSEFILFGCKKCNKNFATKQAVDLHMESHQTYTENNTNATRGYLCDICDHLFHSKYLLIDHIIQHMNVLKENINGDAKVQ